MKLITLARLLTLPLLLVCLGTAAENIVLHSSAYNDVGQVMKGETLGGDTVENLYLSRFGVSVAAAIMVDEKLTLNIGAGGLFWYPFPVSPLSWWTRRYQFGPGISEASLHYAFTPDLSFKAGFFGYKYNPDARNLGEYLLRSEAYPGLVSTGGWSFLNSAVYQSLGMQLQWTVWNGWLTNDLLLFSEMNRPPIFDVSPTYVGTLRLGNAFEVGGGVSLHRLLPVHPSSESPRVVWKTIGQGNSYLIPNPDYNPNDPAGASAANPIYLEDTTRFYSLQGVKVMARASLDFKAFSSVLEDALGPKDMRLYFEAALLGVKNYPYYYEKPLQRIPMMAGFNFPTFKMLDLLSLEVEYYANPWADNQKNFYSSGPILPVWVTNRTAFQTGHAPVFRDDWKWSIEAARTLFLGLTVQAQIANDHMRLIGLQDGDPIPANSPLTRYGNHWYYVVRLQWGI